MERTLMFTDWKNSLCENRYSNKSSLQIQSFPHQDSSDILYRNKKKSVIHRKEEKTLKRQRNLNNKEIAKESQPLKSKHLYIHINQNMDLHKHTYAHKNMCNYTYLILDKGAKKSLDSRTYSCTDVA